MMKLLIPIIFALTAFVLFIAALQFSRYKKRKSGCCGGAAVVEGYAGKTCDRDENRYCVCETTPEVESHS
jgi:hypothetical protein